MRVGRVAVLALIAGVLSSLPAGAQTFIVNSALDELGVSAGNGRCETAPGNGICTLRRAMAETRSLFAAAPSPPPAVTIVIDVPSGVITLGATPWNGNLPNPGTLAIVGAGTSSTVIDANRAILLQMGSDTALSVSGVTIRRAGQFAIRASGSVRLDHVKIEESQGTAFSFFNGLSATVTECEFIRNASSAISTGDPIRRLGVLRVHRSIFRENTALSGAAIHVSNNTVELDAVTLVGNRANSGGAISVADNGTLRVVNSTFSANAANFSGGALSANLPSRTTLSHVTFAGNTADADRNGSGAGGAIDVSSFLGVGAVLLNHAVLSGNTATTATDAGWIPAPSACAGTLTASGPNLFDAVTCTVAGWTPTIGSADLSPLQDNGGPTPTYLPLVGSTAINGGQIGFCPDAVGLYVERDQRGRRRPAGAHCDLGSVEVGGAVVSKATRSDVNGDGKSDLLWEHASAPWRGAWFMNGAAADSYGLFPTISDTAWRFLASDDVDGDGKADVLWRHAQTGHVAVWLMDGLSVRDAALLMPASTDWRLAGTGDVDGDSRADLVWEQEPRGSGVVTVWFLGGTAIKGFTRLPPATGWSVVGVADANADSVTDLLWQHTTTRSLVLWLMANGAPASGAMLPSAAEPGWTVAAFADLNGDLQADLVWRQDPLQGAGTAAWLLDGTTVVTAGDLPPVSEAFWRLSHVLDTDGDGRADLIWRGTDGQNARWRMNALAIDAVEYLAPVPDLSWRIK